MKGRDHTEDVDIITTWIKLLICSGYIDANCFLYFLMDTPSIIYLSVFIDRTASGFRIQTLFLNIPAINHHIYCTKYILPMKEDLQY